MRPSFIRLVVVICFLCSFFSAFSQVTLFGDVYIAPKNEIHILSGKLFFESGKIITDRGNNAGILSFAKGGSWERANHDTHVDGFIRFYEASAFTFPVGHDNILQPLRISNFSGSDHFDLAYQHRGSDVTSAPNGIAGVSDTHYWDFQ